MTWSLVGWAIILLAAVMLILSTFLLKTDRSYRVRRLPAVDDLVASRTTAVERGRKRQIVLGHRLWSPVYPGLGLQALAALPTLAGAETTVDGGQSVSLSEGSLLVLARQVVGGGYSDGFSEYINETVQLVTLPGVTPLSFTAGFLHTLAVQKPYSTALFGNYGPEGALWAAAAADRGGDVFAAGGSLASQAVLFLSVRDLLFGEEAFLVPGLISPDTADHAGWLTEDILRVLLVVLLIVGAALKMGGIL